MQNPSSSKTEAPCVQKPPGLPSLTRQGRQSSGFTNNTSVYTLTRQRRHSSVFANDTAAHDSTFSVTLIKQRRHSSVFANDAAAPVYNIGGELRRHSLLHQQQQSNLSVADDLQDTVSYDSETEILYHADVVSDLVYRIGNELRSQAAPKKGGRQATSPISELKDRLFSSDDFNSQLEVNNASGDLVYCKAAQGLRRTSSFAQPILLLNDGSTEITEDHHSTDQQIQDFNHSLGF